MEGTDVAATTVHALFQLDGELHSKLDFSKLDDARVTFLMQLEVLLLDEVSMIDVRTWNTIVELLSVIDHNRRPDDQNTDAMGNIHVVLFGDFKSLGCNLVPIPTRLSQKLT